MTDHPVLSSALAGALAIATLIQVVATATVLALTAITPLVAADLGIGPHWIGYQVSLIYFSGAFASAVAGTLVLRHGPVAIEQVVLVTFVLGFLGLAGGSVLTIVLGSLAIGIGYGLNNPASSHILNAVTPKEKRNVVYSVKQAGVPIGAVVASLVFPPLAQTIGWQLAFLGAAAIPAVAAVALMVRGHTIPFDRVPDARFGGNLIAEQRLVWRRPALRTLAMLGLLYSAVQLSLSAFAVTMLVHDAGWSLLAAGSVAAAMQVGGAVGRVVWGVVADRVGAGFLILGLLGLVSGVLGVASAWMADYSAVVQVGILVVLGMCSIGWNGVLLAETARNAPAGHVGPVTGAVLVYIFIGVMVGPASFAGLYAATGSYALTFAVFGALSLTGTVIAWRLHAREAALRSAPAPA
ncbi:MFS transporter [Chthonobacter rhizosphaerae]|uniref:MFS transporter n=1 Tax=Chthonobacter rhizosphaerae TaxID=2735553 RepID=UPI0015EEEAFA|nr:MFS transporter [Chthonobacter rhizosphaerae]